VKVFGELREVDVEVPVHIQRVGVAVVLEDDQLPAFAGLAGFFVDVAVDGVQATEVVLEAGVVTEAPIAVHEASDRVLRISLRDVHVVQHAVDGHVVVVPGGVPVRILAIPAPVLQRDHDFVRQRRLQVTLDLRVRLGQPDVEGEVPLAGGGRVQLVLAPQPDGLVQQRELHRHEAAAGRGTTGRGLDDAAAGGLPVGCDVSGRERRIRDRLGLAVRIAGDNGERRPHAGAEEARLLAEQDRGVGLDFVVEAVAFNRVAQ
jgi:hypothetical protein